MSELHEDLHKGWVERIAAGCVGVVLGFFIAIGFVKIFYSYQLHWWPFVVFPIVSAFLCGLLGRRMIRWLAEIGLSN